MSSLVRIHNNDSMEEHRIMMNTVGSEHVDFVAYLPFELALVVMRCCSAQDIARCASVSHAWYTVATDDSIWFPLCRALDLDKFRPTNYTWWRMYCDSENLKAAEKHREVLRFQGRRAQESSLQSMGYMPSPQYLCQGSVTGQMTPRLSTTPQAVATPFRHLLNVSIGSPTSPDFSSVSVTHRTNNGGYVPSPDMGSFMNMRPQKNISALDMSSFNMAALEDNIENVSPMIDIDAQCKVGELPSVPEDNSSTVATARPCPACQKPVSVFSSSTPELSTFVFGSDGNESLLLRGRCGSCDITFCCNCLGTWRTASAESVACRCLDISSNPLPSPSENESSYCGHRIMNNDDGEKENMAASGINVATTAFEAKKHKVAKGLLSDRNIYGGNEKSVSKKNVVLGVKKSVVEVKVNDGVGTKASKRRLKRL